MRFNLVFHDNLGDGIQAAITNAPCGLGYLKGKGWFVYDVRDGCKEGEPEFFVPAQGRVPIPLTNTAAEAWASLVRAKLG